MSANEATTTNQSNEVADKGKGKANESVNDTKDVNMDESEVSSDEEEVCDAHIVPLYFW